MESVTNFIKAVSGLIAAITAAAGVYFQYVAPMPGAVAMSGAPWWATALLVVGVIGLLTLVAIFIVTATRKKDATTTPQPRAFPEGFMDRIERLCADEHEIGLRARTAANSYLQDRDRFRGVIAALEAPCADLKLTITLQAITRAMTDLGREITNGGAYHAFNDVSQALKRELADRWQLVRAP